MSDPLATDPLAGALLALRAKATSAAELRLLELVPASVQARARLVERDAAVRSLLVLMGGGPTERACEAERLLRRYLVTAAWREDRQQQAPPEQAPATRAALCRLALANDGRTLGWRQLMRAASVTETGGDDRAAAG